MSRKSILILIGIAGLGAAGFLAYKAYNTKFTKDPSKPITRDYDTDISEPVERERV